MSRASERAELSARVLQALAARAMSYEDAALALGEPLEVIREIVNRLHGRGHVRRVDVKCSKRWAATPAGIERIERGEDPRQMTIWDVVPREAGG